MAEPSPVNRAIFNTVCASLRLAGSSSGLLTISQLLGVKENLHATLAVISGQIQAEQTSKFANNVPKRLATHPCFTDDQRVIIDLSDWESASDEEIEGKGEDASVAGSKYPI